MNATDRGQPRPIGLRKYVWMLAGFWSAAVAATLTGELLHEWNEAGDVARAEARGALRRDLRLLRWYATRGNIYVPVTRRTQPSPYLANLPDRDITTTSGQRLTLMNPEEVTRQVFGSAEDESDLRTHLTSLDPSRPENAPEPWEREAMQLFAGGEAEVSLVVATEGETLMCLMRPLRLERGCLKCHGNSGLSVGDAYGGISVAVPMASVWSLHRLEMTRRVVGYGSMWLLGLCGIVVVTRRLERSIERHRQAEKALQENNAQMLAARRIQKLLLPDAPPTLPGFDIAAVSHPAEFTSGDYFDYFPMLGAGTAFAIGDVCGHGLGPALLAASTHALLRSLAETHGDIREILAHANPFVGKITRGESFVTLLFGCLDPRTRSFRYASAGHPTGYVLDASGAVKIRLESTGLPLGIEPEAEFPVRDSIVLEPGDTLLLLTDGILEARSPELVPFGAERTLEIVRANRSRTAEEILASLVRAVCEFARREAPLDDMTAIAIKVGPAS